MPVSRGKFVHRGPVGPISPGKFLPGSHFERFPAGNLSIGGRLDRFPRGNSFPEVILTDFPREIRKPRVCPFRYSPVAGSIQPSCYPFPCVAPLPAVLPWQFPPVCRSPARTGRGSGPRRPLSAGRGTGAPGVWRLSRLTPCVCCLRDCSWPRASSASPRWPTPRPSRPAGPSGKATSGWRCARQSSPASGCPADSPAARRR